MALMLRYRTTHDRAFHKCLSELRTLRKERREEQEEFDSQNNETAHSDERSDWEREQFESQNLAGVSREEPRKLTFTGSEETNRHLDRRDETLRIANEANAT